MYGEVDNIKFGKVSFPNWRNILSYSKQFFIKKKKHGSAVGTIEVHLFIEFRKVHVHTWI